MSQGSNIPLIGFSTSSVGNDENNTFIMIWSLGNTFYLLLWGGMRFTEYRKMKKNVMKMKP